MNLYSGAGLIREHKAVVTIWAEERGRLDGGFFDFSFGDGSRTNNTGYPMMCPGRIIKMGLSGGEVSSRTTVIVTVNRTDRGTITKEPASLIKPVSPADRGMLFQAAVTEFKPPIELSEGDVLNFKSGQNGPSARSTIVTLLVELDL